MPRPDGRAANELRPVTVETNFTENPMGSALIRAGKTMVLCTASVEEDIPRWMKYQDGPERGWVTAEYNMLPASTHDRSRRERNRVGGRTMEIQRLIGRSLRAVVDLEALGKHTITLDCEVLQADGGTRTASITGSFIALALACDKLIKAGKLEKMPFTHTVAAISCGIVDGQAVLDLPYVEDSAAAVDMNIIMNSDLDLIEVQGTGEESTFSRAQLNALLNLGEVGVKQLADIQRTALREAGVNVTF